MPILTHEQQDVTVKALSQAGFSAFFTLTTRRGDDDPLNLRHYAHRFIERLRHEHGHHVCYWFAVCLNDDREGPDDPLYHIHGFLSGISSPLTLARLGKHWYKTYRKRHRVTGERKKHWTSLGRTDFQQLRHHTNAFAYVAKQIVLPPCTNFEHLTLDEICVQVAIECGEVRYAS